MRNIVFMLYLLGAASVNAVAQENPKEFMYSPRSGSYAESFTVTQKLFDAIAGAKVKAMARGINLDGFSHVSVSFEGEKVIVTYFNLSTLDGPYGEIELTRPDFTIKSIK